MYVNWSSSATHRVKLKPNKRTGKMGREDRREAEGVIELNESTKREFGL